MKEKQPKQQKEGNSEIYLTVIFALLFLGLATFIHDPILHSVAAIINGWSIDSYDTGLVSGQTNVIAPKTASLSATWFYFMFPSIFIYVAAFLITIFKPNRFVMVGGIILMALNLASLHPRVPGSDAYSAIQVLINNKWTLPIWAVFVILLLIISIILFIIIKTKQPDMPNATSTVISATIATIIIFILDTLKINVSLSPESSAYVLHYLLFLAALVLWGLYLYVVIENSPKDARSRMRNIVD